MPNWAYTIYIVRGDGEKVARLHQVIKELDDRAESLLSNGFGKLWMGNVVYVLGGDWGWSIAGGRFWIMTWRKMGDFANLFVGHLSRK